ncbi:DNA repair protein rad51d [Perkinsus olseni]|uniref:DNA repair protein rad51d n=1 Tax=Perkinsus olseni TaxID=32597 RepID=A0A7J6QEU3_PEROL|nr:DNA repair protein rad51d [Perkinsus olseni]
MAFNSANRPRAVGGLPSVNISDGAPMGYMEEDFLRGDARSTLSMAQSVQPATSSLFPSTVPAAGQYSTSNAHVRALSVAGMEASGHYHQGGAHTSDLGSGHELAMKLLATGGSQGGAGASVDGLDTALCSMNSIHLPSYSLPQGAAGGVRFAYPPLHIGGPTHVGYGSRSDALPDSGLLDPFHGLADMHIPFAPDPSRRLPQHQQLFSASGSLPMIERHATLSNRPIRVIRRVNGWVTSLRAGRKQVTGPYRASLAECLMDQEQVYRVQADRGLSNAQLLDVLEAMKRAVERNGATAVGARKHHKSDYSAPVGVRRMNKGFRASVRVNGREVYGPLRTDVDVAGEDRAEMLRLRHVLDVPRMREFVKALGNRPDKAQGAIHATTEGTSAGRRNLDLLLLALERLVGSVQCQSVLQMQGSRLSTTDGPPAKKGPGELKVDRSWSGKSALEKRLSLVPLSRVICYDPRGLSDECSISHSSSKEWLYSINMSLAPKPLSAREYGQFQRHKVSTGMLPLDELLQGGLPVGQLVELYGPAGSGKTQLLMTIAVRVLADEGRVFWFDTERTLHPDRFKSLCERWSPHASFETMLSRMAIKECDDLLDLARGVEALKALPVCGDHCLIVIDSVAAAARCSEDVILSRLEADGSNARGSEATVLAERQGLLNRVAVALKGAAWLQRAAIKMMPSNQLSVSLGLMR